MKLEGVYVQMGVVTTICLISLCGVVTGDQSHLVCSGISFEFSSVVRSTHQDENKKSKKYTCSAVGHAWGIYKNVRILNRVK